MTPEDCLERARGYNPWGEPPIGGTGTWPATANCPTDTSAPPCAADGGEQGMISRNGTLNPLWYNANIVWIGYCDGGSFSGALEHPLHVGNDTIYLRGRRVLEAVIRDVVPRTTSAAEVVIKGCSAGGQAAFIHANFLAEQFSHVPRVSVMPGAGFFLDIPSFRGPNTVRPYFWLWYSLHNISGSLPVGCLASPPEPAAHYLCMFPQYILPHIDPRIPLFVSQSLADLVQQDFVMQLGCDPKNLTMPGVCDAGQVAYVNDFRGSMLAALAPVLNSSTRGLYAAECSIHVIVDDDGSWARIPVQGHTQAATFAAWYSNTSSAPHQVVDGRWGSNPTCLLYSPE